MDTYIHIVSWIGFVLLVGSMAIEPALFGRDRGQYTFGNWFAKLLVCAVISVPIYLRVLGFI